MKITSWNINGIRSLKKSVSCILDEFSSDIVCFQETKISRSQLLESTALIDGYTSYFNYPRKQTGYSGVATYSKDRFTPDDAEEDLLVDEQYGVKNNIWDISDDFSFPSEIDFEGRVIVTHHLIICKEEIRRLAVINVYCPRVDPEKPERHFYKLQFCQLLQKKMYQFCLQGYFVVVVGDLNIAYSVIDHCDPGDEEEFNASESRQWLKSFFSSEIEVNKENIKAVDAFRHFYPDKKGAFTCWNTKTGARLTNYGTRIDYIIVSSNLVPFLSDCKILSEYEGSDHCPIFAEIKCDSVPELNVQLPSICTRLWPEFSGHQQKLQAFFQKVHNTAGTVSNVENKPEHSKSKKTVKNKQKPITIFFKNNTTALQNSNFNQKMSSVTNERIQIKTAGSSFVREPGHSDLNCSIQLESHLNSSIHNFTNEVKKLNNGTSEKPNEWKSLLSGPPKPPLCDKHKKPCVLRTVKKNGPNIGRQFFMCAQPVGSFSNPDANCNYFQWVTAPKINVLKRT